VNDQKIRSAVLGGLISLCFVGMLLKRVNLYDTWQTLRSIDARLLVLPLLMFALNYPLRALRWQLIFPRQARPDYWATFRAFAIGTGSNNVVPGRAGDVARCVLLAPDSSLAGSSLALATLAIEKVLDGLVLLAIVLLACVYISPPNWLTKLAIAAMFVFGGALVVICAVRFKTEWFRGRVQAVLAAMRLRSLAKKAAALFGSFNEGLHGVASIAQMLCLAAITALIWATEAGLVWAIAKTLGLPLSLPYSLVVAAVIGLGLMIPAGPASIGTYEFFVVAAMGLAGIASGSALAYALLLHAWVFVTTSVVGLVCLALAGLTLKQLAREEETWQPRAVQAPIRTDRT
jgi:glycosyltransferase 2 family protein